MKKRWKLYVVLVMTGSAFVSVLPLLGEGVPAVPSAIRLERISAELVPPLEIEGEAVEGRTLEVAMEEDGVPGLALAVVDDCRVAWSHGWGDLGESEGGVTGQTPFQVASVSKMATATVAMTMVASGELDLDRPVNDLLRSWKLPASDFTKDRPVTVRHLLSHSAGLTRTAYGFDRSGPMPALADILAGKAENPAIVVEERPGVRTIPSNSGFLVLQQALEDLSGSSLAALAKERVFSRLAMTSTAFEPVSGPFLDRAAPNHGRDGAPIDGKAPLVPGAPGGLWSSAEDLGRLLAALMDSLRGRPDALMPREVATEMLSPTVGEMALGMHLRSSGETFSVQQAGGGIGSTAHVVGYPERCQGAAIVVNRDGARRIVAETLAAVGREYGWPDLPLRVRRIEIGPGALEPLVGVYEYDAAPGSTLRFSVEDDGLQAQFGERDPIPLIAASESLFVWPGAALEMRFDEPVEGRSPGVSLGTAGLWGSHLTRIDAAPPASERQSGGGVRDHRD